MSGGAARPWTVAVLGLVLGATMTLGVSTLAASDLATWGRVDPQRPSGDTCETSLDDFDRSARTALVGCDEPHRAVVLGREVVGPRQPPYPGDDAVKASSDAVCARMWAEHGPVDQQHYELTDLYPGADVWNDGSRRTGFNEVFCMVTAVDGGPMPVRLAWRDGGPQR